MLKFNKFYDINHPNYQKCKDKDWHVDHIFSIKAFLDHKIYDLKIINVLDNLSPLEGMENLSKADNYDLDEFQKWLKEKNK